MGLLKKGAFAEDQFGSCSCGNGDTKSKGLVFPNIYFQWVIWAHNSCSMPVGPRAPASLPASHWEIYLKIPTWSDNFCWFIRDQQVQEWEVPHYSPVLSMYRCISCWISQTQHRGLMWLLMAHPLFNRFISNLQNYFIFNIQHGSIFPHLCIYKYINRLGNQSLKKPWKSCSENVLRTARTFATNLLLEDRLHTATSSLFKWLVELQCSVLPKFCKKDIGISFVIFLKQDRQ